MEIIRDYENYGPCLFILGAVKPDNR